MWETVKSKKDNTILCLEYEGFAFVEVDKITKDTVSFLSIEFEIYDLYRNSLMLYKMDDVTTVLNIFKSKVEELDKIIDDMSDQELDLFLDKLDNQLNEY